MVASFAGLGSATPLPKHTSLRSAGCRHGSEAIHRGPQCARCQQARRVSESLVSLPLCGCVFRASRRLNKRVPEGTERVQCASCGLLIATHCCHSCCVCAVVRVPPSRVELQFVVEKPFSCLSTWPQLPEPWPL